ncbi:MAG: RagB/SusD family nutrient uptake outer membrane protein [Mangrovibacterium sp.]
MKIKTYTAVLFATILLGLVTPGCSDDYLESENQSDFDDATMFSNETLTENMIFYIYSYFANTNSHRGRFTPYYGHGTDCETFVATTNSEALMLCNYGTTPDNSIVAGSNSNGNPWGNFYKAIEVANLCLEGIQQYGNPTTDNLMGYYYGEALLLRAIYYYDLIRGYGDVPARFEPTSKETIYLGKSDRDVIFKQLIDDLEIAADYLPWPGESEETSDFSRANKAFCKGLRARLILMACGYSQRPDVVNGGTGNSSCAPGSLSSSDYYPSAKSDLEDIIESGTCILESSFRAPFQQLHNDDYSAGHSEILWALPYGSGRGRVIQRSGVYHAVKDQYTCNASGGQTIPVATLFYDFDSKDLRRNITCVPYKWGTDSTKTIKISSKNDGAQGSVGWNFGKFRYEWFPTARTSSDDGINFPYMRYSDVLLMYAEICNELGDLSTAKEYLKEVRSRAFAAEDQTEKVTNYVDAIGSKDDMLAAIQDERKFEFAGEALRKADLIRWNLLGTRVSETLERLRDLRTCSGEFNDVPGTVYWAKTGVLAASGKYEEIQYYGLERGETGTPPFTPDNSVNFQDEAISYARLNTYIYQDNGVTRNPDKYQFWPISTDDINYSNGQLVNDYGY